MPVLHLIAYFFPATFPVLADFALCLINQLGNFDPTGTNTRALKVVLTGPHPVGRIQDRETVFKALIPAVV